MCVGLGTVLRTDRVIARCEAKMFDEEKTTQMAASFLKLAGNKMNYMLLLKMLYVADKTMLMRRGMPITFDYWVSMDHGPVLSHTLDRIKDVTEDKSSYWRQHIERQNYEVVLTSDPGNDELSRSEDQIIVEVFAEWGNLDPWEAVRRTHKFPEWQDPMGSSIPIALPDVMRLNGAGQVSIDAMLENVEVHEAIKSLAKAT